MSSKNTQKESLLPPLWIITIILISGVFWLITELRELVVLSVMTYAIAYVMDPLLDFLERKKIRREIGFFIVTFAGLIVGTFFIMFALPPLAREVEATIANSSGISATITDRMEGLLSWINQFLPQENQVSFSREQLMGYAALIDANTVKNAVAAVGRFLLEGYSIGLALVNFILLPLMVFYLAVDIDKFHAWFLSLIPKSRKKVFVSMMSEINGLLRAFIVGQSTVSIILAILYSIGFAIAGHTQWFFLGVVSGIGNIVPYLGTISGMLLAVVFSLTTDEPLAMLIKTGIVFTVVQLLEGMIITPKIVGDKVGLSPLIVILAIIACGKLFGLLGVFLAVPIAAALKVIGAYAYRAFLKRSE